MNGLDWIMPVVFLTAMAFIFLRLMAASREAVQWQAQNEAEQAAEAELRRSRREAAFIAESSDVDVV